MPDEELSLIEVAFVAEYLLSENAAKSYRLAFRQTRGKNCTHLTARTEGRRLLTSPHVVAELAAARNEIRRRHRAKADKVITQLGRIAFADIDDVVDLTDPDNPRLRPRRDIPAAARAAIQEVSRNEYGVKIKLRDSLGALRELANIFGLHKEPDPLEVLIARLPSHCRGPVQEALAKALLGGGDHPLPGDQDLADGDPEDAPPTGRRSVGRRDAGGA